MRFLRITPCPHEAGGALLACNVIIVASNAFERVTSCMSARPPDIVGLAAVRLGYDVYHRNSAADGSYNHRPFSYLFQKISLFGIPPFFTESDFPQTAIFLWKNIYFFLLNLFWHGSCTASPLSFVFWREARSLGLGRKPSQAFFRAALRDRIGATLPRLTRKAMV